MSGDTERLFVQLEARIADFEKKMKKAESTGTRTFTGLQRGSASATRRMESDMNRAGNSINRALTATSSRIGSFGKSFAAGLAGGVVAAGFAALTTNLGQTVRGIAAVSDEARRAGVSLKVFQEWKFVAEQNRIAVDQMADGLKELSLRADEFIATGGGPAAEAFARLGFGADDLARRLQNPSELMLEMIDRLGKLDTAAQIRVADEVFGGSAGERFVALISQGEAGLRNTIDRAHEVGAVMDDEMIAKAVELDRRWGELSARVSSFFKEFAVNAAGAAEKIVTMRTDLDEMFRSYDQAKGLLGPEIVGQLEADAQAADENAETIGQLRGAYEDLADRAGALIPFLEQSVIQMRALGYEDPAATLSKTAEGIRELNDKMRAGTIDAAEYERGMLDLSGAATTAFSELDSVDTVEFSGAIAALSALASKVAEVITAARTLRQELPGGTVAPSYVGDPRVDIPVSPNRLGNATASDLAPSTSIRPQLPGIDASFGQTDSTTGSTTDTGTGGGGGAPDLGAFEKQVAAIRDDIAQLSAEAAELTAVANSGQAVGDAMEYARKRAELLYAAQRDGRELTPELRSEIDALALSYTAAGQAAEDAADRLDLIKANSERGAEAMSNLFGQILDGSMSAKEAVGQLLIEIGKAQLMKAFATAAGGPAGPIFAVLGSLLGGGFAEGGYTGNGGALQPAGVVHGGEYVFSKRAVDSLGVDRLDTLHEAARGYSEGGAVAPVAAGPGKPPVVNMKVVNVIDPADVLQKALATDAGQRVMLNMMSQNARTIGGILSR